MQSGREDVLLAIRNIPIDLSTASTLIGEGSLVFLEKYKESSPSEIQADVSDVVHDFEIGIHVDFLVFLFNFSIMIIISMWLCYF